MDTLINQLAPVTNQITASILNSLWKGAAMTLTVWLILMAFKQLNAATRHVIWSALLVSVGALTCIGVVNGLQNERVAHPAPNPIQRTDSDLSIRAATEVAVVKTPEAQSGAEMQTRRAVEKAQPDRNHFPIPSDPRVFKVSGSWSVFFVAGWALVTTFLLRRLLLSFLHLKKLKRTAALFDDACHGRFQDLLKAAGIRRSIRLCTSGEVTVPVALGLSDPLVLIPKELSNQLAGSELDQIVLHEAAHLARRDDWSNLVERVLVAMLFFHPAVHWISRRLCLEREIACDDWVTSVTGNAKPYALCLTKLAELTRLGPNHVLASGAWLSKTQLSRRIIMLLNDKLNRTKRVSIVASAAGVMGLCGLLFVFSQVGQIIAADNSRAGVAGAQTAATANLDTGAELPPNLGFDLPKVKADALLVEEALLRQQLRQELNIRAAANDKASSAYTGPIVDRAGRVINVPQTAPQTDEERRKAAQLREQVFASLLETMKNETNSELRSIAMNSLVRMQPGKVIEPLLEIVVKDANHQMRIEALSALAGQPGTACTEALLKLYDELEEVDLKTAILRMLGSRHSRHLTGDNLATTEKWIAKLQQIAKESPSRELKVEAIRQLGRVGENLLEPPREK